MNDMQSLFGFGVGSAFGPPSYLNNQQLNRQQQMNYCPCCGRHMSQFAGLAGLQNASLSYLYENSRKPQPLPNDKDMKARFENLSRRIDAAVEKYKDLLT